jgi:hypothetical protein
MSQPSERFGEYLLTEEPLRGVYAATLSDDSAPKEVTVGVTDRRLLCLSEDGTFLNIGYDSICAVRSKPRSRVTYRGNDSRVLLGGGAALAVLAFVGLVAFTATLVAPVFALATVGAIVTTASVYRSDDAPDLVTLTDIEDRTAADVDADALRRAAERLPPAVDARRALLFAGVLATLVGIWGTSAVAASSLAVLFLLPMVGGVALVDYARRYADDLDGIEIAREQAQNVRISTDDGRTVRLETDPSAGIDRELSRLAFVDDEEAVQPISARA